MMKKKLIWIGVIVAGYILLVYVILPRLYEWSGLR